LLLEEGGVAVKRREELQLEEGGVAVRGGRSCS